MKAQFDFRMLDLIPSVIAEVAILRLNSLDEVSDSSTVLWVSSAAVTDIGHFR